MGRPSIREAAIRDMISYLHSNIKNGELGIEVRNDACKLLIEAFALNKSSGGGGNGNVEFNVESVIETMEEEGKEDGDEEIEKPRNKGGRPSNEEIRRRKAASYERGEQPNWYIGRTGRGEVSAAEAAGAADSDGVEMSGM